MKSRINKLIHYRLIYPGLLNLPFPLAYKLVSRLKNPLFEETPEVINAYSAGLMARFPELREESGMLDKLVAAHSNLRSRDDLDSLALPKFNRENSADVFQFSGIETFLNLKQQGKGVIVVMAHYGRPLIFSRALSLVGGLHGMLTQTLDSAHVQLDREEFLFRSRRMRNLIGVAGGDWFTLHSNMRPLYNALQSGKWVIIMCDLFDPNPKTRLEIPFLGGRFLAESGIARLAKKTGALLAYGVGKEHDGSVLAELKPLPEDPEAAVAAAFAELEKDIFVHPWQWWQWNTLGHAWIP